jgi:hypothetical protein
MRSSLPYLNSAVPSSGNPLAGLVHTGSDTDPRAFATALSIARPLGLQAASDLNPDLLVVGGYSHRPLQESIFGGATRSLLEHAQTPIFMMH